MPLTPNDIDDQMHEHFLYHFERQKNFEMLSKKPLTPERRQIQSRLACFNTWWNLKQMRAAKSYLSLCRKRDELQEKKLFPYLLIIAIITFLIFSYYFLTHIIL